MKIKTVIRLFSVFLVAAIFFLSVSTLSHAVFAPIVMTNPNTHVILDKNDPKVHAYFNKIAAMPYNIKNNNCKNKTEKFVDYLTKNGATEVYIVEAQYKDGTKYHEFIQWQGKIYDPTLPAYGMNVNDYDNILKYNGITGLQFITKYA